jgi:hypothetical protein
MSVATPSPRAKPLALESQEKHLPSPLRTLDGRQLCLKQQQSYVPECRHSDETVLIQEPISRCDNRDIGVSRPDTSTSLMQGDHTA